MLSRTDEERAGDERSTAPRRGGRPGPVRLIVRWFSVLCLPLVLITASSLFSELTRPGNMTATERLIEWLRSHNGGAVVNQIERWYYSHRQPKVGGALTALPGRLLPSPTSFTVIGGPSPVVPPVADPLPGEGTWQPVGPLIRGFPSVEVTYLRPDAVHTTLVAALAWIDRRVTEIGLVPGRTQPGHGPWPGGDGVPPRLFPRLLAAFNSGFRLADARGGFYLNGKTAGSLREGAASFVLHADGTADVEAWGRDATLSSSVVGVRQNLALIVDRGRLAPGIDDNVDDLWGKTLGNSLFVWRSGVGVDAGGNLIYAAGDGLSVRTLGELLRRAGALRAMELDINRAWVSFNVFPHDATGQLVARSAMKLLPDMAKPSTRYLTPDDRDFIAVLRRS